MTVSAAKLLAVKRYRTKTYDTIGFDVKKGKRDEYKAKAAALGMSLAAFLSNAAESYGGEGVPNVATVKPALTAEQRKILDAVDSLPESSRKALLKFLQTLVDAKSD